MKKNLKFLIIGAVMTGVVSMAHAQTNNVNDEVIKSSITSMIKKQFDKGLMSEKADINIKFAEAKKIVKYDDAGKKVEKEEYDLSENDSERIGNYCKINLSFDKLGNIPYLGHDDQLMNLTKFQNERQKDMARQFVALHEQSHCEFSSMKNTVKLKNASEDLIKTSNYILKDMEVMNLDWGNGGNQVNYLRTVNESYADVSAMILMMKEYGTNDSDLNYVLKAIEVQRNDNYLQKGAEEHNTHFSIKKLFEKENITKIDKLNDKASFQDFTLTIANEGVQNLMTQRKDFTEQTLTKDNFVFSVIVNLVKTAKKKIESENPNSLRDEKASELNSFTSDIAIEMLKNVDLKKYSLEKKTNEDLFDFASKVMESKENKMLLDQTYNLFNDFVKEFKENMYKNNEKSIVDFDSKTTKEEVMKRVNTLRTQFIQATQNKSTPSGPN